MHMYGTWYAPTCAQSMAKVEGSVHPITAALKVQSAVNRQKLLLNQPHARRVWTSNKLPDKEIAESCLQNKRPNSNHCQTFTPI